MTRSDRTLIRRSSFCDACEGQALALRGPGRFFFGALRGTGPRATAGPQAPVGPDRLIRTCLSVVCDQAITNYRGERACFRIFLI